MTLPRKIRRSVTVDGTLYYWAVTSDLRDTVTVVVAQIADDGPRQLLKVWLKGQYVFTPKSAEFMIRYCLKRGWDPKKGGTFHLDTDESQRMVHSYAMHVDA